MDKNKIIEAAAKLVAKGAYDKAIKEYEKVLAVDPKDVRVLQKMGELYQKKNENEQAATYFTKVAESYATDGFFLKAVALYKQVLKLNPNLLEVNLKLAELHQQLGLMSEAMAYFQLVANAQDKAGDTKASLDTLKKMVDLDPDNVASRIKLAELYARDGINEQAIAEFTRAAEYLKSNNRGDDYARVAERLSALSPDNLALAKELAHGYLGKGDQKRALAKLQVCFKADPRDVETLSLLAEAFQGLGQVSKTISVYKELAKIYQEKGQSADAKQVWSKIEVLDANDADLSAQRGPSRPGLATAPSTPAFSPPPRPAPASPPRGVTAAAAPPSSPPPPSNKPPPGAILGAAPTPKPAGNDQLAKLLTETDVYVKYGLHDKALEHLRKIFAVDPENLDAHEKAYNIYVSANNSSQAADQLLNVLRLCTRRHDVTRAQPYLATILQQNPNHPEVPAFVAVLKSSGAPVAQPPEEAVGDDSILVDSSDEEIIVADAPEDALAGQSVEDLALETASSSDEEEVVSEEAVEAPPDSYDDEPLDATRPGLRDDTLSGAPFDAGVALDAESELVVEDDLLDGAPELEAEPATVAEESELVDESPTREFERDSKINRLIAQTAPPPIDRNLKQPFDSAADDDAEITVRKPAPTAPPPEAKRAAPVAPPPEPKKAVTPAAAATTKATPIKPPPVPAKPKAPAPEPEVEAASEELEEAGFFLEQGLSDEAREILETVLIAYPNHPRAQEMMARLEQLSGGATAEAEAAPAKEQDAFDLAAELADIEGTSEPEAPSSLPGTDDFQVSVDEVFAEFKKGLEKVVKPEDVETHYDLGIAYKEMGLTDDAIGEFEQARAGCIGKKKEVDCFTMIGMIQELKGDHEAAVTALKQGLSSEHAVGEPQKALLFELGSVRESMGQPGKALFNFQRVAKIDPSYRDVTTIVSRLASGSKPEDDPLPPSGPKKGGNGSNGSNGAHTPSGGKPPAGGSAPPAAAKPGDTNKARKVGYL